MARLAGHQVGGCSKEKCSASERSRSHAPIWVRKPCALPQAVTGAGKIALIKFGDEPEIIDETEPTVAKLELHDEQRAPCPLGSPPCTLVLHWWAWPRTYACAASGGGHSDRRGTLQKAGRSVLRAQVLNEVSACTTSLSAGAGKAGLLINE